MGSGSERQFEAGSVIFREGDAGDVLYILQEGAVELKKKVGDGETILKTIDEPNDFFGEMALIDGRSRSASAVAASRTTLLVIDGPAFESMIVNNGRFALKIIKVLSERLRRSNKQVEELIETAPKERIMFGMVDFAVKQNDRTHGGYRVGVDEMRNWINNRLGHSMEEIDACLFRLLKSGTVSYAANSRLKEHIILHESFIRNHDRRG